MSLVKKLLVLLMCILIIQTLPVLATDVTVNIPSFDVKFNEVKVDNSYRQFPLVVYKDITYIPMTYYDCRHLGLVTRWDNNTRTLAIEKEPVSCAYRNYNWEWKNSNNNKASVCDFNIIVNGKKIDNTKEEYPLLAFRDVTYFPLTWRFAVDEFAWEYSFDSNNGLLIKPDNKHIESVNLPNIAGSVATDDKYYYYNGNAGDKHVVYRVPTEDTNNPEIIFEHPDSGMSRRVNFIESEGNIYFYYTLGSSPVMSRRCVKKINSDGTLSDENPAYFSYSAHGYNEVYARGNGIEVKAVNPSIQSATEFSYTINGVTTEVEPYLEPIELGIKRNGKTSYSSDIENYIRIHGEKIYFTAKSVIKDEDSALYVIDTKKGEIEKLLDGVYGFHVYTGWDDKIKSDTTMIIYDNNGTLMRYKESDRISTPIEKQGEEDMVLIAAAGDYTVSTIQRTLDGRKTVVKTFDCYASGSGSINEKVFETSTGTRYVVSDDIACVYAMGESDEDDIRIVVPHSFYSSDVAESVFVYDNTLIYTICEENTVLKVDLK